MTSARFDDTTSKYPAIQTIGLSGILVTFSENLTREANQRAIAFARRVTEAQLPWVRETSSSMTATFISITPEAADFAEMTAQLRSLLADDDGSRTTGDNQRKHWRIPACFEDEFGPQLAEIADLAGLTREQAIAEFCGKNLDVLALGFAPGLPYLGLLPAHWDIPRQTSLTQKVPAGALVVAIRQCVMFTNPSPTGWRQIGQTAFKNFAPTDPNPFKLSAGDSVSFVPFSAENFRENCLTQKDGGATWTPVP